MPSPERDPGPTSPAGDSCGWSSCRQWREEIPRLAASIGARGLLRAVPLQELLHPPWPLLKDPKCSQAASTPEGGWYLGRVGSACGAIHGPGIPAHLCLSLPTFVGGSRNQHWSLGSQAVSSVCPLALPGGLVFGGLEGQPLQKKTGKGPMPSASLSLGQRTPLCHAKEPSFMKTM